ncbi:MAG TPA: sterol desaturase family protein [Xanthobacteraceae bacterium]|jgi:sterol desaturase/sphingolipid hydroxylase (fatty acid hydroxylase superfamily)|nr:sterol desaturase family protein [Xanthobacteraceae bacterium]
MSGFSSVDAVTAFYKTWDRILATTSVFVLTYMVFASAVVGAVLLLRRSGFKFQIRKTMSGAIQVRREITHSIFSLGIFMIAMLAPRAVAIGYGVVIDLRKPLPLWEFGLCFPLICFLHDTYFYWTHRLMHLSGFYRIMHREHHRSVAPTAYAAYSFAFLEALVQGLFPVIYVVLFPADMALLVVYLLVEIFYNTTIHSGMDPFPPWLVSHPILGWLAGSAYHDMHHRTLKWNFGLYFRFWDRLMGTEHPDFVRVHNYIHSPDNDGDAYSLLGR